MSLGGIAIAIGVMVDASVVLVENAHKHLERNQGRKHHTEIIIEAAKEVGPALFYSLLIITVSFMPVLSLQEQSGRLFKPLAYTYTFAIAASSLVAITIVPVCRFLAGGDHHRSGVDDLLYPRECFQSGNHAPPPTDHLACGGRRPPSSGSRDGPGRPLSAGLATAGLGAGGGHGSLGFCGRLPGAAENHAGEAQPLEPILHLDLPAFYPKGVKIPPGDDASDRGGTDCLILSGVAIGQ
jgi:hypothetical protein